MKFLARFIALLLITTLSSVWAKAYTMADLNALAKKNQWSTVLEHIQEISPAQRNAEWSKLLQTSAVNGFDAIAKSDSYALENFLETFMSKYTELQKLNDFSFKVAKTVRLKVSDTQAVKYFDWGLAKKPTAAQCSDDDLKTSLTAAFNKSAESDDAKIAKKIAFGPCFDSLKDTLNASIVESKNSRIINCTEMTKKAALSKEAEEKCKS